MHYYIDGYNLMFRIKQVGGILQKDRELFISKLEEMIGQLGLDVTIVFDAQHKLGRGSRSHRYILEICFTDEGETADDFILNELYSSPKPRQETVVTSDNQLAWRARRLQAHTETVESFFRRLEKGYKKKEKREKDKPKKATPPPIIQALLPASKPRPDSDFDYYLDQFEKNLEKEEERETSQGERRGETETNRWLRLFMKRLLETES